MNKYEKLFKALSDVFDITPLNEQIDDFENCLNEQKLEIVDSELIEAAKRVCKAWDANKPDVILGDKISELNYLLD